MILALSVREPYAGALFDDHREWGRKGVENRTRPTGLRGRLAIHSSAKPAVDPPLEAWGSRTTFGAVLGTVELVDCHREGDARCVERGCRRDPWAEFADHRDPRIRWHYVVEQPREFVTPIPAKGALGFWQPGPSLAHLLTIAVVRS